MTPETSLKHAIKDYLNMKGIFWWYNLAGVGARKGIPDLCAVHRGTFYGIEVKTPAGRLSDHQAAFGVDLTHAGGVFIIARSLDDVMGVIK